MTNGKQSSASKRLVILVSGGGSNLQSLIDGCASGNINANVSAVISNNPDAGGLERAAKSGIPNVAIDHRAFESRESFDQALSELIVAESRPSYFSGLCGSSHLSLSIIF